MASKATSAARPLPRRNTRLYVLYGDKDMPDVWEGLAKYRPLLEALGSDTLSITIEDLPQEMHAPHDSLSKGLKQIFDGYVYPYELNERLTKEGVAALESHYEQLSRRLGFRVPVPKGDLMRLANLMLENGQSADLKAMARVLEQTVPEAGGLVHLVLLVAHYRANEMDLMMEHYRVLEPFLERAAASGDTWTPKVADWPKIVEAAKAQKSDSPGPRKRPATGPPTR